MAPDGTRWAGLSAVHVAETPAVAGWRATVLALLAWAAGRAHPRLRAGSGRQRRRDRTLRRRLGFTAHHRSRYVDARSL